MKEQVQVWLTQWFTLRGKNGNGTGNLLDVDYFGAGWLSSMEIVEFVTEIESQFGMQFSDQDLRDPRFVTIGGLADLILERCPLPSESR